MASACARCSPRAGRPTTSWTSWPDTSLRRARVRDRARRGYRVAKPRPCGAPRASLRPVRSLIMKLAGSLALAALSLLAACKSDRPSGQTQDQVEVISTVTAVDVPNRTLTLKSELGRNVIV